VVLLCGVALFSKAFSFLIFPFFPFFAVHGFSPTDSLGLAARLFHGIAGVPALVDAIRGCFLFPFPEALPGARDLDVPIPLI